MIIILSLLSCAHVEYPPFSQSKYEPGKRHWLKVKKDYLFQGAMADSTDLVVLGAWYGTGQKGLAFIHLTNRFPYRVNIFYRYSSQSLIYNLQLLLLK